MWIWKINQSHWQTKRRRKRVGLSRERGQFVQQARQTPVCCIWGARKGSDLREGKQFARKRSWWWQRGGGKDGARPQMLGCVLSRVLGVLQAHGELSRDHRDGSKKCRRAGALFLLRSNGNISESGSFSLQVCRGLLSIFCFNSLKRKEKNACSPSRL